MMYDTLAHIINELKLDIKKLSLFQESNSSQVYLLETNRSEKFILKIPFNNIKLKREQKALALLRDTGMVPLVISTYQDKQVGALLLSYIDGEVMKGPVSKNTTYQMGEALARIHSVTLNKYGDLTIEDDLDSPQDYLTHLRNLFMKSIKYCEMVLNKEESHKCLTIFEHYIKYLPLPSKPCLNHSDYRMGNVLINEKNIVGVIDFEVSGGGVPQKDFTFVKNEIWDVYEGTKDSFLDGYRSIKSIEDVKQYLSFYDFLDTYTKIGWFIKRDKKMNPMFRMYRNKLEDILKRS